jgi:hypothetical protein
MNERIFELAKQADLIQWDTLSSGARTPDHESVVKARKFAELIIKECARVQHKRFCEHGDVSWDILMEYFGVEE